MDDIHGLKPFMLFAPNWKALIAVCLAAAAAAWLVRWWRRRPRRPAPSIAAPPPSVVTISQPPRSALHQLDDLAARRLPESDRVREFHVVLSGLLRAYLAARFGLPARRMTTTELLAALSRQALDEPTFRLLADVLPSCDLAKFARFKPTPPECDARFAAARAVVVALGDLPVVVEEDDAATIAGGLPASLRGGAAPGGGSGGGSPAGGAP